MAEDKQPKGKTSFGDKVKEFFFGNRIDAYSKEEFEKMQSLFGSLSTDIEAALNQLAQTDMRLADKMAASLGKISGFTLTVIVLQMWDSVLNLVGFQKIENIKRQINFPIEL